MLNTLLKQGVNESGGGPRGFGAVSQIPPASRGLDAHRTRSCYGAAEKQKERIIPGVCSIYKHAILAGFSQPSGVNTPVAPATQCRAFCGASEI